MLGWQSFRGLRHFFRPWSSLLRWNH